MKVSFLLVLILWSGLLLGQNNAKGKIEGKVIDSKSNLALAGVSVSVKGSSIGTNTNVDGYYILTVDAPAKVTLVFSYLSNEKTIEEIEVTANVTTHQDAVIDVKAKEDGVIIVKTSTNARKETAASLITFQKNTNTVASVVSAEAIKRSPDRNTGEVIKRTPGASLQDGKFIVIRGLADRYNQAMINGILLTSTEPDRKTFSFDLIPSSMVDNVIINKAFVPELPGEWAGGLIQVNTKDMPAKNFFNIQLGTGFNSQTIGRTFYKDRSSTSEIFGLENGSRDLPNAYTTKSNFDILSAADKTAIGKTMENRWTATAANAPLNNSIQVSGGLAGKLFGKKIGLQLGASFSNSSQYLDLTNKQNRISSGIVTVESDFDDDRFRTLANLGGFGSFTIQFNNNNKISAKAIASVNATSSVTNRNGIDVSRDDKFLSGNEFSYKQNIFLTTQLNGEHGLTKDLKFKWYGSFNILDGYIPDQRRILYSRRNTTEPYSAVIANSLSQQSGSRIYQNLSDYIHTGGGDLAYGFNMGGQKQTIKAGYMLQIKDRLYDAKLFANYLTTDNPTLRQLPADQIFATANFGTGTDNKFAFDAIKGKTFRYMANTIMNAGFLQFDNAFSEKFRLVWGLRVEHYDQLVGSVKKYDPRHTHVVVTDFLPGFNATYKLNPKTNIRFSGSQTVVRPELRELASLNLYDFELNASVQGDPKLERTKITNVDVRYELYPRAGETFSVGGFYKYFNKPIEQLFNEGAGGSSTFSYVNPKQATAFGIEVEVRKKLDVLSPKLKNFTFQANTSYIYSRIKDDKFGVDRPLQGQSPYLINFGLLYDVEKYGLNATILYNQIGDRIYLVGDISAGAGSPDIWEATRPVLDFQVSKKLMKNKVEVRLSVSDILNQRQYFYQNIDGKNGLDKTKDAFRFTRLFGTTYTATINFNL